MPFFYIEIRGVYDYFLKHIRTAPVIYLQTPRPMHPAVTTLVTYLKCTTATARALPASEARDTVAIILTEVVNTQRVQAHYEQQATHAARRPRR